MKQFCQLSVALAVASSSAAFANNKLEEMVVTSSRVEMPMRRVATSLSVIDAEDIQLRGYTSVSDLLRTQPSIGVSNQGGAGKLTALRIRGEEGYRTLVMIDGVDVSDPTGTQVGPKIEHLVNSAEIDRIEILRGPQGFIYGADAGGVVNILTISGQQGLRGALETEGGRYGESRVAGNISAGSESVDLVLSAQQARTEGFNARSTDTVLTDKDGYENTTAHAKLGWTPIDALRAELVLREVDGRSEFDGCTGSSNDCVAEYEQTNGRFSLRYTADNWEQSLAFATSSIRRDSIDAGVNALNADGEVERVEYLGRYQLGDGSLFVYGADLESEEMSTVSAYSSDAGERDQLGVFFEQQLNLENWYFTAGARHDNNDDFGEHTSYRVSTAYVQDLGGGQNLKYRSSYGTGFRAPSMYELAYNRGPWAAAPASEQSLSEELSRGYDIAVEYLRDDGVSLELVYFNQQIEDAIEFDLTSFSGYVQSAGTSRSSGVELIAQYPLSAQWLLLANMTYNDTETPDGQMRSRRPRKLANIGLLFHSDNDRFSAQANLRAVRDSENEIYMVGRVAQDDYEVLDISANFKLTSALEAYGRIENALNRAYVEVQGYNSAGSSTHMGVRYSF